MKKGIILLMILLIILISTIAIAQRQNPNDYQQPFSGGTSSQGTNLPTISDLIIIFGKNSATTDYESAKLIKNNLLTNYNAKLVYDVDYIDDGTSSIISIGGSCINRVSAQLLSLDYPRCGNDFTIKTKVSSSQYLVKTSTLSNNRIAILIAGYEADDTWKAAEYFNTLSINTLSTNLNDIKNTGLTPIPLPTPTPSKSKTYNIDIKNFQFSPSSLSINLGDIVKWTNNDNVLHTVTSDVGSELVSPILQPGDSYTKIIDISGPINYHCSIHTEMKGHMNSMLKF